MSGGAGPRSVHFWCPEMFLSPGGIQRYSRFLLEALCATPQAQVTDVFLKNDKTRPADAAFPPGMRFHFGSRPPEALRTPVFAGKLLLQGMARRPALILSSHLNFSPVARALQRLAGIPFWVVAHGFEAWDLEREAIVRALRACDRVLAVSTYTRRVLIEKHGLDEGRVHLLPNTFDADRFRPGPRPVKLLERYRIPPDRKIILTVARVDARERYKGYDQIVRALPGILEAVPSAHYVLAGRGNDYERIAEIVRELGLEDRATLAGGITDDELCEHYNLCDVFAMPSKREGFGIVFLEAMACGKPVIGGKADGTVDPLLQGELGVLVDPDNLPEIRDAIVAVLSGRHPLAILREPDALRARVIAAYGVASFRAHLAQHFEDFFRKPNGTG